VTDGLIEKVGNYSEIRDLLAGKARIKDYRGKLIMPGFIDTHIHYPQTEMVASYGEQLLEWLDTYTFPTEKKFADRNYATERAKFFVNELLRNGTTTALVFGTVHPQSVDALFTESEAKNMRMIAGKVMMDRNAPEFLLDTATTGYDESEALIKKWHRHGRSLYAITPRFAPTSTPEQLKMAGELKKKYPDVYVHTHLSENKNEIAWVKSLFPDRQNYFDVYEHYGLSGGRSIFAHAIHLEDEEIARLKATDSAVAFCPSSNLFLGSGLFRMHALKDEGIRIGMGTDIGAGTSFSMFTTLNEAYKVMQLQGQKLPAIESLYQATLGGARALNLDDKIGNFDAGKEADFVVINMQATELQKLRMSGSKDLEDRLFALTILGDDRNISATYVMGKAAFVK
jgi:guanine deaminase